jgi:hypothetical protein
METSTLASRTVTLAKVLRSQGLFSPAREQLEMCLQTIHPQDPNLGQVLCSLTDTYCDLKLPDMAHNLISPEIEKERKRGKKTKSLRRVLVTALDVDIQRGLYEHAKETIDELTVIFNELRSLDVNDELLHVRVLVASARLHQLTCRFDQALQGWEEVLAHVQKYKSFEGEGSTYAITHLSISLTYLEIGNKEEAWNASQHGRRILTWGMRDFCIPTFAAWGKEVSLKIRSLTGWTIPEISIRDIPRSQM